MGTSRSSCGYTAVDLGGVERIVEGKKCGGVDATALRMMGISTYLRVDTIPTIQYLLSSGRTFLREKKDPRTYRRQARTKFTLRRLAIIVLLIVSTPSKTMVNTRASKRKSPAANSNDAAAASSAKRSHDHDGSDSDAGCLAVDDGKSRSTSDAPNMFIPQRENDFNAMTWWMVDLTPIGGSSSQGASALVKRCMRTYGWCEPIARRILAAYRQFIILKKEVKDWDATILYPCHLVEQMWHCHILDVVNYYHDMMLLCAHVVGHNPDDALDSVTKQMRVRATRASLVAHFGSHDEAIWIYSAYSESGNSNCASVKSENTPNEGQQSATSDRMRISVRQQLDGTTYSILVRSTDTVDIVKQTIQQKVGIPCEHQILIFSNKILWDGVTFGDYNIGAEDTLSLVTRPAGW